MSIFPSQLSSMPTLKYLGSSVGGMVPMTLLNCYMGSTLHTMEDLMTDDTNRFTGFFIFGGQVSTLENTIYSLFNVADCKIKCFLFSRRPGGRGVGGGLEEYFLTMVLTGIFLLF